MRIKYNKTPLIIVFVGFFSLAKAQDTLRYFHKDSLKSIVSFLAADSLQGRQNFSASLEKAALYIGGQFRNAKLQVYNDHPSYFQPFIPQGFKVTQGEDVTIDDQLQDPSSYFFYSSFQIVPDINPGDFKIFNANPLNVGELIKAINKQLDSLSGPLLVKIPSANKAWIKQLKRKQFSKPKHVLLIITTDELNPMVEVTVSGEARSKMLFNVVGVLKGKRLAHEIVFITAHYDHVGTAFYGRDRVYNGANDNASGTAAMLSLMKHFAASEDNERTIVFVAFAGEELGLLGSKHFAPLVKPKSIVAMFNLEMLGKPDPSGKGALIITGSEHSTLSRIMSKYCKLIKINTDTNYEEKLYTRSDNYHFAQRGIVAHTFMCFTPFDVNYHEVSDEVETLDFENFSTLVKGLLPGIEAVVSGKETPKKR